MRTASRRAIGHAPFRVGVPPPRARGMAAREPLAGVVAPMEVHMAVRTPVATHAISAHRPPVMRPAGSHGAGRPKSARTRWPLSLSRVVSPAHGGQGSGRRSRTSPPSCTEPACAARKSPGSMSAPVAEMHREDARDSKRWNLTQRVDGAGGMGYDRDMAGNAGRADRRPASRRPHIGGDGECGTGMGRRWSMGRARSEDAPGDGASTRGAAAGGSVSVPSRPPVAPGGAPVTRGRRHGLDALDAALIAAVAIGLLIAAFLLVANPWLPPIHYL